MEAMYVWRAEFDKFHVIENLDASVNLYGTFNLLGPAGGTDSSTGGLIIDDDPNTGTAGNFLYQKDGYEDSEEQLVAMLPLVNSLAASAAEARDLAIASAASTKSAYSQMITAINGDDEFEDALPYYNLVISNADAAESDAVNAETAATAAAVYDEQAKAIALSDSRAADEAVRVSQSARDAESYAGAARVAADAARKLAQDAESARLNADDD